MIRDIHDVWRASKNKEKKTPRKKKEEEHRKKLMEAFRRGIPSAVVLRHEDTRTASIPDISVTVSPILGLRTSRVVWLECKAKTLREFRNDVQKVKTKEKKGLQRETLRRLGGFYIIFDRAIMYIVEPTDLSVVSLVNHDPDRPSRAPYDALALIVKGIFS